MSEQIKLADEAAAGVSVGGGAIGYTSYPPVSKAAQKKIVKKN